jgi:hypothetical protein
VEKCDALEDEIYPMKSREGKTVEECDALEDEIARAVPSQFAGSQRPSSLISKLVACARHCSLLSNICC